MYVILMHMANYPQYPYGSLIHDNTVRSQFVYLVIGVSLYIISLSTVVLNSRDWSEIIWLPEISHFKNQPCNRLYPKKPTGMHG